MGASTASYACSRDTFVICVQSVKCPQNSFVASCLLLIFDFTQNWKYRTNCNETFPYQPVIEFTKLLRYPSRCNRDVTESSRFWSSASRPNRLWGPSNPLKGTGALLNWGVMQPLLGVGRSTPTDAEVKNTGTCMPTPHTTSWRNVSLVKHRDNFASFLLYPLR